MRGSTATPEPIATAVLGCKKPSGSWRVRITCRSLRYTLWPALVPMPARTHSDAFSRRER